MLYERIQQFTSNKVKIIVDFLLLKYLQSVTLHENDEMSHCTDSAMLTWPSAESEHQGEDQAEDQGDHASRLRVHEEDQREDQGDDESKI